LKPTVYDAQGRLVALGPPLGTGGEGTVFEVADGSGLAAKVYLKKMDEEHTAKLAAMIAARKEEVLKFAAWPVGSLHGKPGGPPVGFLMPRVSGFKPIHSLYSPKSRMSEFPQADWKFLLGAAANLARAFAAIHAQGDIVVGDINHGNVLVSSRALVKLIDCDSVQITVHDRTFLCGVGVSTHTPPELQGGSLRVLRTRNHDSFGLAVLLFQLLFMGRHPFSGRYLGQGDLALERAIQEFRFAYGRSAAAHQMLPPPHAPDLTLVTPAVAPLFERAFDPEGSRESHRPSAAEWVAALSSIELQTCRVSPAHSYPTTLAACPWCAIEDRAGILLFNVAGLHAPTLAGGFTLESVWAQILAVPSPGPAPAIPQKAALPATPSPKAGAIRKARIRQINLAWLLGLLGPVLAVVANENGGGCLGPLLILGLLLGLAYFVVQRASALRHEAEKTLQEAEARLRSVQETWVQEAPEALFLTRQRSLKKLRDDYLGLPALRKKKIDQLRANLAQSQLQRFLDRHRLDNAKIPGIGEARRTTLESYGIETAGDITYNAVLQVPGFGPALTGTLLEWKKSVTARFVFNPSAGIDPQDIAEVDRNLAARRGALEKSLLGGVGELQQVSRQITVRRQALLAQMEAALQAVAQAKVDFEAM
jgi:DNA-binding helix-hairpin-helix protein with protein kinase domain